MLCTGGGLLKLGGMSRPTDPHGHGPLVPEKLQTWPLGWTQDRLPSPLWMIMFTSLNYGVGFAVLPSPNIVRFMTVPSDRS